MACFAAAVPQGDGCGGEVIQGEGVRGCLFIADLELAKEIEPAVLNEWSRKTLQFETPEDKFNAHVAATC